MPTYKNISQKEKYVKDMHGRTRVLRPGQSCESLVFYDDAELNLLSREPLFRRFVDVSQVTAGDDAYVDLSPLCDCFFVDQITEEVTVFAEADTPENRILMLKSRKPGHPVLTIDVHGIYDRLIIQGSGTCCVTQVRDIPGVE